MRFYDYPHAPNPTKVRVYLAEKGIEIPRQTVNLVKGEQSEPAFLAVNPLGALPVLELDDGTRICQSLAIIEYLEEFHPEPPMIGRNPIERARVRELERAIDIGVLMRIARIVHNSRSPLPGVTGIPEVAEKERKQLPPILKIVDGWIGSQPFVAGDRPTIADCTLFAGLSFGALGGLEIGEEFNNLRRWWEAFLQRPSAKA